MKCFDFLNILFFLLILFGCAGNGNKIESSHTDIEKVSEKSDDKQKTLRADDFFQDNMEETEGENDPAVLLEDAAINLHGLLKRARIIAMQKEQKIYLSLEKKQDNRVMMILSTSLDSGIIEEKILSNHVTTTAKKRNFLFSESGDISFDEPDMTFFPLDPNSKGDIELIFIDANITSYGIIDIIKERTQVAIHIVD